MQASVAAPSLELLQMVLTRCKNSKLAGRMSYATTEDHTEAVMEQCRKHRRPSMEKDVKKSTGETVVSTAIEY
jgi:hypothetical protein